MARPIRVLELRSVRGTGGGPEKTILFGAAGSDPSRFAVTVCYLRDARDSVFAVDARAAQLGVDYIELIERHSFDPSVFTALRRLSRTRAIDIVHAHDYKTDLLAYLLAKVEALIPLATVHGWTGQSRRERFVYYPVDRRLLSRFPHLIAVSNGIRSALLKAGTRPDRVSVVLNGIDHLAFTRRPHRSPDIRTQLGLNAADSVIGAVGRLERQKRFDILIDAVHALLPRHPTLKLVIAGDGSLRPALEDQAAALLPGACRFLGSVPDIDRLHHAFDVFVQSSEYEGTPNAVLEAMAMETPIVATNVGGTSELVTPDVHALVVPPGQTAVLATAIDRALTDFEGSAKRANRARRRVVEHLSFGARMETVERIYEQLAPTVGEAARQKPMPRWT